MFDLHRHDEFSTFDGFGKPLELAQLAKNLGHNALCTTNHGNTNGLIQTYKACKETGIKAVLGVEGYFLPKYAEQQRGYHLILIAKNLQGYQNLNRIQYAGEKQKYYNPIWDFKMLKKYNDGLICSTACVAGYLSQCIINNKLNLAEKFLLKMKEIFNDDFYIEIQPYKIDDKKTQEKVNVESIKLAQKLNIKCILTSDSHRGAKKDFDTYLKMHEVSGHDLKWIEDTYKERYMPLVGELETRFKKMHKNDFTKSELDKMANDFMYNLDCIYDKCESNYLDALPLLLPKLTNDKDANKKMLINNVKNGLKERKKYNKEYIKRAKEELDVIIYHDFVDYFLMVADYVNWSKEQGIVVGAGRGSVCNSIVAYALGITEVDSIKLQLDFRRFLRKDKKKLPDVDLDFETKRRGEVINYLCTKYKGKAARICSYGLYKIDNLINDLAKVCGLQTDKTVDKTMANTNKTTIAEIKKLCRSYLDESEHLKTEEFLNDANVKYYNKMYDNIMLHFSKMYLKVRYIGTHAAGVAITGGNILDYTALRIDNKTGDIYTNYDLEDIENINVIKFDILGLRTMESIGELRKSTGVTCNYDDIINDEALYKDFREGKTDGIFQLEKNAAKNILAKIECDCFNDVVAASSMNRPAPLKAKMPEAYAVNKKNIEQAKKSKYWQYTSDSYGTIIYQEQLMLICTQIGQMSWGDADKVLKLMKHGEADALRQLEKDKKENGISLKEKFIGGAIKTGLTEKEATELFNGMLTYSFVKGHGSGYSLISMEEMYYKHYYPVQYWYCKLKYAGNETMYNSFCAKAVADNCLIFLPHVNLSTVKTRLRKIDGEYVLQQGLSDIKNVGEKAVEYIIQERKKGIFPCFDNFYDRCKSRTVTTRVIDTLLEQGALEFNKKVYLKRVTMYNSSLYSRALRS